MLLLSTMPRLTLWQLDKEGDECKQIGPLSYEASDSFADFRVKLADLGMFNFQFDFWDECLCSRMIRVLERGNKLVDYDNRVTIIPVIDDCNSISNIEKSLGTGLHDCLVVSPSAPVISNVDLTQPLSECFIQSTFAPLGHVVDHALDSSKASNSKEVLGTESHNVENLDCALDAENDSAHNDCEMSELEKSANHAQLESTLISADLHSLWKLNISKLESHMQALGYADHNWKVVTWDENGKAFGELRCLECDCPFSGTAKGVMDRSSVHQAFGNFKNQHVGTRKHRRGFSYKRNLPVLQREVMESTKARLDDTAELTLAVKIMQRVSAEESTEKPTFIVLGDLERRPIYLFYYRALCTYCNLDMALVPQQRNLEHNLREHIASPKHQAALRKSESKKVDVPLLTGLPGRPCKPDGRDVKQKTIHTYFGHDQGAASTAAKGKGKGIFDVDIQMSLLCWGLWQDYFSWGGQNRNVKALLKDQLRGIEWWAETHVHVEVFNFSSGEVQIVSGLFRHKACSRISQLGGGFENLTCEKCWSIKLQTDFRLRVLREGRAVEKRGVRNTGKGRRLDFLTTTEIANQARTFNRIRSLDRIRTRRYQSRICMLQMKIPSLREVLGEAANRKDVLKFCSSIVLAHKRGAFGGREALWDLLNDIVLNLNRTNKGKRYSKGSKVICQALFEHGGRRVVDCLSSNLIGPSLNTLQRNRRGMLYFRTGFREEQFQLVARILSKVKLQLGITGDVPVIIAEDETAVKKSIRWAVKTDSLIGFCGPKTENKRDHKCTLGLEMKVGNGEEGFQTIVNAFEHQCIGSSARAMIVNPLHADFPRLCILATATCMQFDHKWVRMQWDTVFAMWSAFCRDVVGPLIGHASDGDPRRRKLMMGDYSGKDRSAPRSSLGWVGWPLTHFFVKGSFRNLHDPFGLHDSDQIHDLKKLINILDSITKVLHTGAWLVTLEQLSLVYELYNVSEHGMNHEDVLRTDRQNWASAQRLCTSKVLNCLRMLRERKDARVELTLGTEMYLTICGNYNDIFWNVRLDLRSRIVLCAKVSFFFRLWRLWIQNCHSEAGGNKQKLTLKVNTITTESFLDIQLSCHFVVLLIIQFRDKWPNLPVPLHLTGSDCCEQFFSKVGGMKGHERNYDFAELIDAATSINRLAELELTDGIVSAGKSHKKHKNIWMSLHPLKEGEQVANLQDYSLIATNEDVVSALKEGFQEAKDICTRLQMCPTTSSSNTRWWKCPWEVEDWLDEEWEDSEEEEISNLECAERSNPASTSSSSSAIAADLDSEDDDHVMFDDDAYDAAVVQADLSQVLSELLTDVDDTGPLFGETVIDPLVTFEGKQIYKSTLVSQLVGNPTLSKDRLMRVRQSIYFNNLVDKSTDCVGTERLMLQVGGDCGVFFIEQIVEPSTRSKVAAIGTQKSRRLGKGKKVATPAPITTITRDESKWCVGRVQKIKKRYNGKWARCRDPVDLFNRPPPIIDKNGEKKSACEILCNWFEPTGTRLKFKYVTVDPQWVDLESVISTVSMRVQPSQPSMFILDSNDAKSMDEFIKQSA